MCLVVLFWILESWVICCKDLGSSTFLRVMTPQQTAQLLAALLWTCSSALVGQYQAKALAPHLPTHFPFRSCHSRVWSLPGWVWRASDSRVRFWLLRCALSDVSVDCSGSYEILTWFFHSGRGMYTQGTPTQTSGAPVYLAVSFLLSHQCCPDSQTSGTAIVCLLFPLQSGNCSQRTRVITVFTSEFPFSQGSQAWVTSCPLEGNSCLLYFCPVFLMIMVKGLVWYQFLLLEMEAHLTFKP